MRSQPLDPPTYRNTTYRVESRQSVVDYNEKHPSDLYFYSRYENPTVRALEQKLALLEGAETGLCFASGMAAISTTVLALLAGGSAEGVDPARPLLCSTAIYGGAYRLFRDQLGSLKMPIVFLPPEQIVEGAWPVHPRAVYVETPINPTLRLVDLRRVASRAREVGALAVVDGTFAPPPLQRPIEQGMDLVIHSATKFLGGHSDVLAGAVLGARGPMSRVESWRKLLGGVLDPGTANELSRSLKTLPVRLERQCQTALELAKRLERDRRVQRVLYPGLESHPDHALAKREMRAFGGVVTLELRGGLAQAGRMFDALRVFARAVSLGGVESLVALPVDSSHIGYDAAELARAGVTPGMVRLSIGLEDVEDLWEDLDQALPGTGA
jgi:cystathionine beta-lyase/cystathionine gamma-synthase